MIKQVKIVLLIILTVILQVAFFPSHLAEPFKPNLFMIFIVFLGFRGNTLWGGMWAFLLGLLQDSISGIYFGLNGFSFLIIFIMLKTIAHRLYTDSCPLMMLSVFLATVLGGCLNLLLLLVFSVADGVYSTILSDIFPQGFITALITYLVCRVVPPGKREETI
jgi:rod shape-determining protein MreD